MHIDFYDDSTGAMLRDIFREVGPANVPAFVKSAQLVPSEEFRRDRFIFADDALNKFACDTPQDTWLSGVYFLKQASSMAPEARERIGQMLWDMHEVHGLDPSYLNEKQAAVYEQPEYLITSATAPTDYIDLSLLPVHTKEAVEMSARAFSPEILPPDEVVNAAKFANTLVSLCEDYNLPVPGSLAWYSQPVKRSHVIDSVRQRIGFVLSANDAYDHQAGLQKAAAARGVDLPYAPLPYERFDPKVLQAYDELQKAAYTADLDQEFWHMYYTLDKLAGLEQHPGMAPVYTMAGRPVVDDIYENSIKLAGVQVLLHELQKIADDTLTDIAPEAAAHRHNPVKFATALRDLHPTRQHAIVVQLRGV
jgi:hypothetical protein